MRRSLLVIAVAVLAPLTSPEVRGQSAQQEASTSVALRESTSLAGSAGKPGHSGAISTSGHKETEENAHRGFIAKWFERVERTKREQPGWITPVVTVTPRLEQEFRYDQLWEQKPGGTTTVIYGNGKGLELIPAEHLELILGLPPYIAQSQRAVPNGFGDLSFLVKYRLVAAAEKEGDYILTFFLAGSVPSAAVPNGAGHGIITPTVAGGKGWAKFDFQTTVGISLPTADTARAGRPLRHNVAFQYRIARKFWPELEVNTTHWPDGLRAGKTQVFLSPGLVVGRLPIARTLGLTIGAGFQIAATRFHEYNHSWIITVRLPF
jgi:hypothetical protein